MIYISLATKLKIWARDEGRCRWPFDRECEGGLTPAHILNRSGWPHLIDEADNIVLLCLKHHNESDGKKGKEWMRSLLPVEWQKNAFVPRGIQPTHVHPERKYKFRRTYGNQG